MLPDDIIRLVAGNQFPYQSLRFFGGLRDADIDEIQGVDPRAVCRDQAQAKVQFRRWLSSWRRIFLESGERGHQTARGEGEDLGRNREDTEE
jgi:hypothetical protein